jgi:predicted nucleic acid-binding protein
MIYALDTNILSYLLRGDDRVARRWMEERFRGGVSVIPLIVYYEAKRGLISAKASVKLASLESLCQRFEIIRLTVIDINLACRIYADRKSRGLSLDDADILIAAQALCRGYTLVTNNIKHFEDIDGLKVVNWA